VTTEKWSDWSCAVAVTAVSDHDLEPAVAIVRSVMAEVEIAASRFRDDSDLSRINAQAGRYVTVRPMTVELVELALDAARRTGGRVTPTVGAALLAQGYDDDIDVVRARSAAPAEPAPVPAADDAVRVDPALGRVGVAAGTVLDLGALAKAYAVDEAIARIAGRGLDPVLVSIGGDLAVHGEQSWQISVSETADAPAQLVTLDEGALATSSILGRRWGQDRHHIIDPGTGAGAAGGRWRTATVWAPTTVEANLLSTWALVDADGLTRSLVVDPCPARMVTAGGVVTTLHGWPAEAMESAS